MSTTRSLLEYLDAPVLVGDPDGRVVYLNPSFESRFGLTNQDGLGQPMAKLFEGGAREAVLGAVAAVCGRGESQRFQISEGGCGYVAVASPISNEGDRVGVVILLTEEQMADERVLACSRDFQRPIDDLMRCLEEFAEQLGGGDERRREVLEDAMRAAEMLRKQTEELESLLSRHRGRSGPTAAPDGA